MKNKETVCAVVVTYNRKELLLECLEALLNQTHPIDALYLIDNASTDNTPELLLEEGYITQLPPENINKAWELEINSFETDKIKNITFKNRTIKLYYVRMHQNTGGAGGFYEGVKRGYQKGYDWLWLMDDDAEAQITTLKELISFKYASKASFLAPQVIHKSIKGHTEYYHHKTKIDLRKLKEHNLKGKNLDEEYYSLEANGFVGPLLNSKAIQKLNSFPDESFFIWWDDTDYTYSLFKSYGKGYLVTKAILFHKDIIPNVTTMKIDWKYYYGVRNKIRFFKKHVDVIGYLVLSFQTIKIFLRNFNRLDKKKLFEYSIKELLS